METVGVSPIGNLKQPVNKPSIVAHTTCRVNECVERVTKLAHLLHEHANEFGTAPSADEDKVDNPPGSGLTGSIQSLEQAITAAEAAFKRTR